MPAPTSHEMLIEGFDTTSVKTDFQNRLKILKERKTNADQYFSNTKSSDQNTLNGQMQALKAAFGEYVKSGGVTNAINQGTNNNPPNGRSETISDRIQTIKTNYNNYKSNVYEPLKTLRQEVLATVDVNSFATNVTNQIEKINTLRDQLKQEEENMSTAYTRDRMVETKDSAVSYHQTWGFLERPLKKRSIPILIVVTVVLAVAAVIGIYLLATYDPTSSNMSPSFIPSSFKDKITGIFSKNSI